MYIIKKNLYFLQIYLYNIYLANFKLNFLSIIFLFEKIIHRGRVISISVESGLDCLFYWCQLKANYREGRFF
jgi:hypothetical protein